jgi:O-methyltransferase
MKQQLERFLRNQYVRWIRPRLGDYMHQQRLKTLLWYVGGYWPLLLARSLTMPQKLALIRRFVRVDWHVSHGHTPFQIACVCRALAERPAKPGEAMLEAGCFQGGSSAKFSILCKLLGYRLHIYDSFCGVEDMKPEDTAESYDFSGEFASPESVLLDHLKRYGEPDVCDTHPGWFADTLGGRPLPYPVRVAYIDCDLAKGTHEVLESVVPALTEDGWAFSQDYHIKPVRDLLSDPQTWQPLNTPQPAVRRLDKYLASIRLTRAPSAS